MRLQLAILDKEQRAPVRVCQIFGLKRAMDKEMKKYENE
jgi:hypothetical protein